MSGDEAGDVLAAIDSIVSVPMTGDDAAKAQADYVPEKHCAELASNPPQLNDEQAESLREILKSKSAAPKWEVTMLPEVEAAKAQSDYVPELDLDKIGKEFDPPDTESPGIMSKECWKAVNELLASQDREQKIKEHMEHIDSYYSDEPIPQALYDQLKLAQAEERLPKETSRYPKVPIRDADSSESPKGSPTVLDEAAAITSTDRNKSYGPPRDNHSCTAALWSAYLGVPITYRQVCWLNVLQKASRDAHKPGRDNLVDGCGFLRNIEMADNDEGRESPKQALQPGD